MFTFFKKKSPSAPTEATLPAPKETEVPTSPHTAVTAATPPPAKPTPAPTRQSWFRRIKDGLSKTRQHFEQLFRRPQLTETDIEQLEEVLILADCGLPATTDIINTLKTRFRQQKEPITSERLHTYLTDILIERVQPLERAFPIPPTRPHIITLVGVNGAGKTTTIGKLTHYLQQEKLQVLLAAGDTFRAAAQEQLQAWGKRNHVTVIGQESGDPASVIFDALSSAEAKHIDVVIADTAGRLPTQKHLMAELEKIHRVILKKQPAETNEILLVIDGTSGQNVLSQIAIFQEAMPLTGLIVTKLDGSAKGGIIVAMAHQYKLPIYFLGMGERKEDLIPFQAKDFVAGILGR